jgi:hypothetical protein
MNQLPFSHASQGMLDTPPWPPMPTSIKIGSLSSTSMSQDVDTMSIHYTYCLFELIGTRTLTPYNGGGSLDQSRCRCFGGCCGENGRVLRNW